MAASGRPSTTSTCPTFNRPNVTLVDVAPLGVQQINERGIVHDGVQYDLDVLVYATGFDFMSIATSAW